MQLETSLIGELDVLSVPPKRIITLTGNDHATCCKSEYQATKSIVLNRFLRPRSNPIPLIQLKPVKTYFVHGKKSNVCCFL